MTRAMAAHHGLDNIRVNCVAPGMVYTPMVRVRGMTDELRQSRINQNLLRQEGTAWDVGNGNSAPLTLSIRKWRMNADRCCVAILFLCSREAKWITGLIMPVDGGVSLSSCFSAFFTSMDLTFYSNYCRLRQVILTGQVLKLILLRTRHKSCCDVI